MLPASHPGFGEGSEPVVTIKMIAKECGFGCECASIGEVYNALSAGMEISDVLLFLYSLTGR